MFLPPPVVLAWMSRHHGLVTRARAVALGMPEWQIDRLVATGQWISLHRGVYAAAGCPATPAQALLAAVAACGPGAEASHRSAAWLRGLYEDAPATPVVTVPYGRARRIEGVDLRRRRRPPGGATVNGIPTTPAWVVLRDLARCTTDPELVWLLDRAFGTKLVRPADLLRAVRADLHHAGSRRLLAHLAERGFEDVDELVAPTVSESLLWRLVREAGLPPPEREVEVRVEGHTYALDTAYPHLLLAYESDGHASHSSPEQISRDHDRRAAIRGAGYDLVVFTHRDLTRARQRVVRRLQVTYVARSGALLRAGA